MKDLGGRPIEAQACGCPVVASDIPPLLESLRQSAVTQATVQDETGMAEAIADSLLTGIPRRGAAART